MSEQNQQTTNPEASKRPLVRTMRSDVEEMFKKTKPSFLKIVSQEANQTQPKFLALHKPNPLKKVIITAVIVLLAAGAGVGGLAIWKTRPSEPLRPPKINPPAPFFASETSRTITGDTSRPGEFIKLLNEREDERGGTLKRVLAKIEEEAGEHFATFTDLAALLNLDPPKTLLTKTALPANIYFYYQKDSGEARFGFAARVTDQDRTWADMLGWEARILGDLRPIIFKDKFQLSVTPFEDRTYRNIDWRYQKLSSEKDIGIAYTIFPAKNLLVVASSKEMMETIINRLFEAR